VNLINDIKLKNGYNRYKCNHCGKILLRESNKEWIKSYCESSGKHAHLIKVAKKKSA